LLFTDDHHKWCARGPVVGTRSGTSVRSHGGVLSIAKLRVGQEAYQLSGVAQSLDDYYTGRGEADGQWMGAGAVRLGLDGPVSGEDLRAVLAGMAPGSGGLSPNGESIRPHPRRVPGFDLTFKAPKSVSTLYAVSDDPRVQGAIIDAGEAALRDALGWLEREAIHVRRGTGNERFLDGLAGRDPVAAEQARIRTLGARGVVAAVFRHRTSRAGDPLLHWHTLVPNMVEGPDGRWSAFVHPDLYRVVRAVGEVFQTVLRDELSERLGVVWRLGRHVPEIAGIPQSLCDVFSKRSYEIESWLEATGTPNNREGRQLAVLATRRSKPEVESERFDAAWKAEALAAGWGPDASEQLIATLTPGRADDRDARWRLPEHSVGPDGLRQSADRVSDADGWVRDLLATLTVEDSTFTRADVVCAVAACLGDGATMATVERVVARAFASPETIPIDKGPSGGLRWTSAELLAVEHRFLDALNQTRNRRPVESGVVEMVIGGRALLGGDQAAAVRALAGSSGTVTVLVGPAGTGKTFTLDTVRAVFEAAGYRVIGAAPSARAALELEAGAGIGSSTLQRLTGEWSRGYNRPDADTVLIVDEAGMAGVRDLEALVTATVAAGGRVVLAGDHRQLPEVTAGGGFAAAANRDGVTVAELTVNRRQQQPWEQVALVELRDGHVAAAVAAYRDHGRVVVTDDNQAMLTAAVEHWFTAQADGLAPVLLAGTNETVDALNRTVRAQLAERGLAGDVAATFAGREFRVGERLVLRHNSYHEHTTTGTETAVFNGQTATVTAATDQTLIVCLDRDGSDIALPAAYVESGGIDYGYALTSHRAQGGTWDLAIGVGVDGLYREAGYLQLSRGRVENWLILTAADVDLLDRELERHDSTLAPADDTELDVDEDLVRRLNLSRAKLLASSHDPHAHDIASLADTFELDDLQAWSRHSRSAETDATTAVGTHPTTATTMLARAEHAARHVATGQTVKASDRHNIGSVVDLADNEGRVTVEFVATDGRTATRDLAWHQIEILDPNPPERDLTPAAVTALNDIVQPVRQRIDLWHQHLAGAGVEPDDAHVYEAAARLRIDRTAARLAADQPAWLTQLIGERPAGAMPAQVWDDTVREIATDQEHNPDRARAGIGDNGDVTRRVAHTRVWLAAYTDTPIVPVARTRSTGELHARRRELDVILDSAPADYTTLIGQLREGGQLSFDDTTQLLVDALAAQDTRSRWILAHWPHIVEYAETNRTLDHGVAGIDTRPVLDTLANSSDPTIAASAATQERWLDTLLAAIVADASAPTLESIGLITDVAHYRQRWAVTGPDPLGSPASLEQATERSILQLAIERAAIAVEGVADRPAPLFGLDTNNVSPALSL
jgi:conjugative relaxase-like TrwC/TraI family protein